MAGSLKWNIMLGISGFLILFVSAWTANEWQTSLIRGTYGFFLLFLSAFVIRFVWGLAASPLPEQEPSNPLNTQNESQEALEKEDSEQMADIIRSLVQEDPQKDKNEQ